MGAGKPETSGNLFLVRRVGAGDVDSGGDHCNSLVRGDVQAGDGVRRYAAKVDENQAPIVKALREIPGCVVKDLSRMGDGWPDLAVGYRGTNFYLEVKGKGKKLTDAQRNWHAE